MPSAWCLTRAGVSRCTTRVKSRILQLIQRQNGHTEHRVAHALLYILQIITRAAIRCETCNHSLMISLMLIRICRLGAEHADPSVSIRYDYRLCLCVFACTRSQTRRSGRQQPQAAQMAPRKHIRHMHSRQDCLPGRCRTWVFFWLASGCMPTAPNIVQPNTGSQHYTHISFVARHRKTVEHTVQVKS